MPKPTTPPLISIKETCLYVNDLAATYHFYRERLGLPCLSFVEERHVFFRAGHSVLLCFLPESTKEGSHLPPHYGEGQLHFAFCCAPADYQGWKDYVEKAGITIEHEETWPGGYKSFYFRDPDQHCVEIVMEGMWHHA